MTFTRYLHWTYSPHFSGIRIGQDVAKRVGIPGEGLDEKREEMARGTRQEAGIFNAAIANKATYIR